MGVSVTGITEEARTVIVKKATLREETVAKDVLPESDEVVVLKIDRIVAFPGETISWDVGDRLVSIWFPDSGVFVTPVLAVQHKGTVEATIRSDAKPKVYEYAIYDHDGHRFVTCESHPKLEIPVP